MQPSTGKESHAAATISTVKSSSSRISFQQQSSSRRPAVSVFIACSLDGFIARSNGDVSWLDSMHTSLPGEDYGYAKFYASVDCLLMGRSTYEKALSFPEWPYEGKRLCVLTHRPLHDANKHASHGETATKGDIVSILEDLGKQGVKHVYLDGGNVIQQALKARVVDRLTISWVPVVLGDGISLFGRMPDLSADLRLKLESCQGYPSGLVQTTHTICSDVMKK